MKWIGNFDMSLADITSVVAGDGLNGGGTTGVVTLNVDASLGHVTTLAGLTTIGATGVNTLISSDDVQIYNPVNDGNPTFSLGSSDDERLRILVNYQGTTTQLAQAIAFKTYTESATANDGKMQFVPDEAHVLDIDDGGIDFKTGFGISINGTDILTDSSGEATLSNINVLDATTIATIEAAVEENIDSLKGPITLTQGASGGGSALLIDNDDIDQRALEINAANTTNDIIHVRAGTLTTANAIFVSTDALTTGSALKLDVDDSLTVDTTKHLLSIDYDKAGVTASSQSSITHGLNINMNDAATNHANGSVDLTGIRIDTSSANAQGTINHYGIDLAVGYNGNVDLATGIRMQVDDGGEELRMYSTGNATDYCTVVTGVNGATTITTVDGDGSNHNAHFEVAADGDITLDSAGQIKLEPVAGNNILLDGTITVDGGLIKGAETDDDVQGQAIGISAGSPEVGTTADIAGGNLTFAGGQGKGTGAGGDIIFRTANAAGSTAHTPLNSLATALTISDDLSATFSGDLDVLGDIDLAGDIDVDGTLETDALTIGGTTVAAAGTSSITTLGTIATGVWNGTAIATAYIADDAVTFAKASGVSPNVYGNIIKILPSDFMINDDAASPLSFKDGSNSGLHVNDTASEAIAFIAIPEGMTATHVDVYGTHNKTLKVWEVDVNDTFDFTSTTKGTGAMNTQLDIADVDATADNYLAIQVTLTATTHRIWGGKVTIAPTP